MIDIPETMYAVVSYGPRNSKCEKVPVPRVKNPGEVLLKIEGCGICAGDIKAYNGGEVFWGNATSIPYLEPPAIGGHEFIGKVVEIDEQTSINKDLKPGDRVAVEQIVPCGKCRYCLDGKYSLCVKHDVFGFKNYLNGGFAEYTLIPETGLIYKIPEDMHITDAVLIEPYACSYHAIERAKINREDYLVISGCGPLGLGMITAAKLKNPRKLIALDLFDERLNQAKKFGADIVINPGKTDAVKEVLDITNGYGCDVYIEATGHAPSVTQGLEMICKNGRFVEFSLFNEKVTCNWSIIGDGKELDLYGVSLSPNCFLPVIDLMSWGKLKTSGIVTHSFKLKDFKKAFGVCTDGKNSIKVIFEP